jgi:hypothetical protein
MILKGILTYYEWIEGDYHLVTCAIGYQIGQEEAGPTTNNQCNPDTSE